MTPTQSEWKATYSLHVNISHHLTAATCQHTSSHSSLSGRYVTSDVKATPVSTQTQRAVPIFAPQPSISASCTCSVSEGPWVEKLNHMNERLADHWSPLTAEAWRIHPHLPYVNLHGNALWGLDHQNELICKVVWGETPTHWNRMESSSDNLFLRWGCSDGAENGQHFLFSSVFYSLFWMHNHWLDYMTIFSDLPVHEASREPVLLCFAQTWTYSDANRNSYVWGL